MLVMEENTEQGRRVALLTPEQVADRLYISVDKVYRLLKTRREKDKLRGIQIGREWRIPEDILEQYIKDHQNWEDD